MVANPVQSKIERAKKHIHDLEIEVHSFINSNPYQIGAKHEPEEGELVYYVSSARDVPMAIACIAGDAVQNLRSALDYMVYELIRHDVGREPSDHVCFPIFSDAEHYKRGRVGKVKGMRRETIERIDAFEPYKGGNDLFWCLRELSNIDKHRSLLTIGAAHIPHNLGEYVRSPSERTNGSLGEFKALDMMDLVFRSDCRKFPLETGTELLRIQSRPPGVARALSAILGDPPAVLIVDKDLKFPFDIALGEPEIFKGESLLEKLYQMGRMVEVVTMYFGF